MPSERPLAIQPTSMVTTSVLARQMYSFIQMIQQQNEQNEQNGTEWWNRMGSTLGTEWVNPGTEWGQSTRKESTEK